MPVVPASAIVDRLMPEAIHFGLHRLRYFRRSGPPAAASSAIVTEYVTTLGRDGVVIVPGFMNRTQALALGRRLREAAIELCNSLPARACYRDERIGLIRILDPGALGDEAGAFFADPTIRAVAESYTCKSIASRQRMFEMRAGRPVPGPADQYHVDEAFYFKFKAFLYLSDVEPGSAPYAYLKGSHLPAPWRRRKERQILRHDLRGVERTFGYRGNFFEPREIAYLKKSMGFEEAICTGPAGTLILTDTRGIHRATTPQNGGRLMLGHYFELPRKAAKP